MRKGDPFFDDIESHTEGYGIGENIYFGVVTLVISFSAMCIANVYYAHPIVHHVWCFVLFYMHNISSIL